jgi:hypothetical protein
MLHYKWIDSFSGTFLSTPLPHVSSLPKGERDEQRRVTNQARVSYVIIFVRNFNLLYRVHVRYRCISEGAI